LPLSYKDINGGPDKLKGVLLMIVVVIFKDEAGNFSNLTYTATYEDCKRRLRLYFSDLKKVKERIITGEIITIPYFTFQKGRRINKEKRVKHERRRHLLPGGGVGSFGNINNKLNRRFISKRW